MLLFSFNKERLALHPTKRAEQQQGEIYMQAKKETLLITQFSLLLAIEAIFCFTPLGSLPAMGPIVATLGMIPVALTGILLGVGAGAAMGAFAGLFSFCVWSFIPPVPLMAFVFTPVYSFGSVQGNFWSIVICFVPRIFVGIVASVCYRFFSKRLLSKGKTEVKAYMLAGALGSLANTFGVLGGVFIFFGKTYADVIGEAYNALLFVLGGQVLTSGVPEAIVCAIVAMAVCGPVKKVMQRVG